MKKIFTCCSLIDGAKLITEEVVRDENYEYILYGEMNGKLKNIYNFFAAALVVLFGKQNYRQFKKKNFTIRVGSRALRDSEFSIH